MRYPWLNDSKQEDGGYWLPCIVICISKHFRGSAQAGVLASHALTDFMHAIDSLKKHEQKDSHKEAVVRMNTLNCKGGEWPAGQCFHPDQQCSQRACC